MTKLEQTLFSVASTKMIFSILMESTKKTILESRQSEKWLLLAKMQVTAKLMILLVFITETLIVVISKLAFQLVCRLTKKTLSIFQTQSRLNKLPVYWDLVPLPSMLCKNSTKVLILLWLGPDSQPISLLNTRLNFLDLK